MRWEYLRWDCLRDINDEWVCRLPCVYRYWKSHIIVLTTNSTEKRVRLKGTASVIGQFRRDVIGPLSVKPWGYWLWWLSFVTGAFRSIFLLRLSIHLFLIKLSVISHSVVVDFVTRYALINNKIQRSLCAKDTDC